VVPPGEEVVDTQRIPFIADALKSLPVRSLCADERLTETRSAHFAAAAIDKNGEVVGAKVL
jgi:hypothetical protein